MYLMYESYFLTELTLCFYRVVGQIDIFDISLGSSTYIKFVILHKGELQHFIISRTVHNICTLGCIGQMFVQIKFSIYE